MSINFKTKNNEMFRTNFDSSNDGILNKLKKEKLVEIFIKNTINDFDNHFLNYISNRKQRDLMIFNEFLSLIIEEGEFEKKNISKYESSNYLVLDKKKIKIDNQILPIDATETIIFLEKEMSILKTYYEIFKKNENNNIMNNYKNIFSNLDNKIKKVSFLNDNNMFQRITRSDNVRNNILKKIGIIKSFNEVSIDKLLYCCLMQNFDILEIN